MGNTGSSSFSGTRKASHRHTRGRSARSNNNNNNNTEGVKEDVSTDNKRLVQATSISATNNRVRRAASYVAPSFNKTRKARKNTRGGGGRRVVEEVKPKNQAEEEEEEEIDDSI